MPALAGAARLALAALITLTSLTACHAEPDDPAGQAKELEDPVRRQNALGNIARLYTTALAEAEGDRDAPAVKAVVDATVEALAKTYVDHPEDNQNRTAIIELLAEMRDPRSLPALVEALDWRPEVNEDQAVRAAQTIRQLELTDAQKSQVVAEMTKALDRVDGNRGADRRMMKEFLVTLGHLGDPAATESITRVAMRQSEDQMFLFNYLAVQELGRLENEEALPTLVKALFLADPKNPAQRMDDVAVEGLVRIGRPALEPVLAAFRGENDEVNAIVDAQVEQMQEQAQGRRAVQDRAAILSYEGTFALSKLGYVDSLDVLLEETRSESADRRVYGAIALVGLNLGDEQLPVVREALTRVYREVPEGRRGEQETTRAQLLANMRHLYDGELLPFFLEVAQDDDQLADLRLEGVRSYVLLADAEEIDAVVPVIDALSKKGPGVPEVLAAEFEKMRPAVALAKECDADLACYAGKLAEAEDIEMQKAAYMVGRLGRGSDVALDALVENLGHRDSKVRLAALHALDHIAVDGAPAAVTRIEELREKEEGRSIWTSFKREALPIAARLESRAEPTG